MSIRYGRWLVFTVVLALGACASGPETADGSAPSAVASSGPSTTASNETDAGPQDVAKVESDDLEPGTYFIDPDVDPSTPLRVVYEVPAEGWSAWPGAIHFADPLPDHVSVTITTVRNIVRHGCRDHSPADPPVGSSVDDLATALAELPPFRVTSQPEDVTIYGYAGKHLELTVPDLPSSHEGFTGCVDGNLASWMAPAFGPPGEDAFTGYGTSGRIEELWILDVDGTRLMIAATWTPDSAPEDVSAMRDILGSIRIEP